MDFPITMNKLKDRLPEINVTIGTTWTCIYNFDTNRSFGTYFARKSTCQLSIVALEPAFDIPLMLTLRPQLGLLLELAPFSICAWFMAATSSESLLVLPQEPKLTVYPKSAKRLVLEMI